jgi:peptidoglycan hydrolase-like protein with peptidoglycan-binding domain
MRAAAARMNDERATGRSFWRFSWLASWLTAWLALPLRWLCQRPRDAIGGLLAAAAAGAILVNALFMQSGPHPAPIFANKPAPEVVTTLRPNEATLDVAEPVRARSDAVTEIQRELARRGFYLGAADGVYGPKTDAAIRDFEQAAGLRPSAEPNDALLAAITRSAVKVKPASEPASRNDPIAALLAPSARITAVQRALTDFGYGPLKPTGTYDGPTRASIERFERARKRPVTGQITDQLVRDLAALTGRPLE